MKILMGLIFFLVGIPCLAQVQGYSAPPDIYEGTYSVPTDKDLSPFSIRKLPFVKWIRNNNSVQAIYTLPEELAEGTTQKFTMTGQIQKNNPFVKMVGDGVQGQCLISEETKFVCLVSFDKKKVKFQNDLAYFKERFKDLVEAQKSYEVAKVFSSEPIGILKIQKR